MKYTNDDSKKIIPIRSAEENEYGSPTENEREKAGSTISKLFETLLDKVKLLRPRRNLAQIAGMCSEKIDALILQEESEYGYQYIGGQFIIMPVNETGFRLVAELYFKSQQDEWIEIKSTSQPRTMEYLTKDSVDELLKAGQVAFEIERPKRG